MSASLKPAVSLALSTPAFWHNGRTTATTMQTLLLGLAPAAILAVLHWGGDAIRVMALSMAACVFFEAVCQRIMDRKVTIDDYSAVFEGLLLAFLLPASSPWWFIIIGAAITILLAKMAFGGLGATPLCAPLVGWAALSISWPLHVDPNAALLSTMYVDPLVRLKYFGVAEAMNTGYGSMLLGAQVGALGAGQAGALLLGGVLVIVRGVRRWQVPVAFLAGVIITAGIFHMVNPQQYAAPMFHVLAGSTLLCAFFIAPDPACSPHRSTSMLIYGFFAGAMVVLIRIFGIYTDGAPFAVLLANLLTPQLESVQPKPFGAR